jgi:FHA domain
MPAQYLDEYIRELKRDGEAAFHSRYGTPVLIVTKAGGELQEPAAAGEATVMASSSGWRLQELSLLNRVYPIAKGPFAAPGPIALGRSDASDISVPEESVSKRHCEFEIVPEGVRLTECGSTNGTSVDGTSLAAHAATVLHGGEAIVIGNFSFTFHTAASFLAYVRKLGGAVV